MLNQKVNRHSSKKASKSFLSKLYDILSDNTYHDIIHWNIEGSGIIIVNITRLCNMVLPKFYRHNNYSSFVRQLNVYGFRKIQGIIKEGEGFEHENLNKKTTKEQIKQIINRNKKKKLLSISINSENTKESLINNSILSNNSQSDLFRLLLDSVEKSSEYLGQIRNELEEIHNQNKKFDDSMNMFQNVINGHNILLKKILERTNNNKDNSNKITKKIKNIKQLFNKYLYHLKIYSPFVIYDCKNFNNMKNKIEKFESNQKNDINCNYNKEIMQKNQINNESFYEENSLLNVKSNITSMDLNLNNNNKSL